MTEQFVPEMGASRIVGHTCSGDMGEDTFAFFHHGEPGELDSIHARRAGELGGATDGRRVVFVLTKEEQKRQLRVAELICGQGENSGA
jgi:hypothetical protein